MNNTVRYSRRANLGNFEHHELEMVTVIQDGQDRSAVVQDLMAFVTSALNGEAAKVKEGVVKPVVAKLKAEVPKAEVPKVETLKVSDLKVEETKVETVGEVVKPEAKPRVETKKVTRGASKITAYDRTFDPHKNLLGSFLDNSMPGWKKKEILDKCKETSVKMSGKDFLDANGDMLETFRTGFMESFAKLN